MQVLGSLIKLPERKDSLPLPWWHRSPLGFLHRTPVFVALVQTETRPVGDLIVSVLDPNLWHRLIEVESEEKDQPRVVAKVFGALYPLNIALAETVTVESGDKHKVTIICEPFGDQQLPLQKVEENLRTAGLSHVTIKPFMRTMPPIHWQDNTEVDHGWLKDVQWRSAIKEHHSGTWKEVDLRRAVVSADTERRILRYVFPRKGAMTVRIEHSDQPGALKALTDVVADCQLNVLSALLRRGGAKAKKAILVAVCEPVTNVGSRKTRQALERSFRDLPHGLRATWKIFDGEPGENRIYPRHPEELVARVPEELRPVVQNLKGDLPDGCRPVFLSRRFVKGDRRTRIVSRVRKVLRKRGYEPLEAPPRSGNFATSLIQVSSRMWLAEAGIVLVAGTGDDSFSMNLAHEAGFLQGQGKPVLVLVERGSAESMKEWSNAQGLVAPRFAGDEGAFDPDNPESIDARIGEWLSNLR